MPGILSLRGISIKALERPRYVLIGAIGAVLALWGISSVAGGYFKSVRALEAKKYELRRFASLGEEYSRKRASLESLKRKAVSAEASQGAVPVIEDIAGAIGVKERIGSLKSVGERTVEGYAEREVELRLERVELNEAVNFLYQIENGRNLFVVKEFTMKSRFDAPELLDVTLRLAHLSRPPA